VNRGIISACPLPPLQIPKKKRPDGAWQIFLNDPDGHTIELCAPPNRPAQVDEFVLVVLLNGGTETKAECQCQAL
jgi:hypothetical protein